MTAPDISDVAAAAAEQVQRSGITSYEQFFDDFLAPLFSRNLTEHGHHRWCLKWTEHMEATEVVDALWRSWEIYRLDVELGKAIWMRDFAYPLMTRLFDPTGTFTECNMQTHEGHEPNGITALNHPLD